MNNSDIQPQDICEKLKELVKDEKALLIAISKIDDDEVKKIDEYCELIKSNITTSTKKNKKNEDFPKFWDFIEELKRNIQINLKDGIDRVIEHKPTTPDIFKGVEKMDVSKDKESIIEIHSTIEQSEKRAHIYVSVEGYYRGRLYYELKKKFSKIDSFVTFCENYFKVSKATIYRYLGFYDLVEKYPGILLSGLGVSIIYNNRKNIISAQKIDEELCKLLMIGFPGIKTNNNIINDPDYELDMDINLFDENIEKWKPKASPSRLC
jgi:hypothetical protein